MAASDIDERPRVEHHRMAKKQKGLRCLEYRLTDEAYRKAQDSRDDRGFMDRSGVLQFLKNGNQWLPFRRKFHRVEDAVNFIRSRSKNQNHGYSSWYVFEYRLAGDIPSLPTASM